MGSGVVESLRRHGDRGRGYAASGGKRGAACGLARARWTVMAGGPRDDVCGDVVRINVDRFAAARACCWASPACDGSRRNSQCPGRWIRRVDRLAHAQDERVAHVRSRSPPCLRPSETIAPVQPLCMHLLSASSLCLCGSITHVRFSVAVMQTSLLHAPPRAGARDGTRGVCAGSTRSATASCQAAAVGERKSGRCWRPPP